MGWLFGKKPPRVDPPSVLGRSAIPRDDDRVGPAPPPRPTLQQPGLSFHSFRAPYEGRAERAVTRIEPGERFSARTARSLLVLSGALEADDAEALLSPGDLLVCLASVSGGETRYRAASGGAVVLLDDPAPTAPAAPTEPASPARRIVRDDLVGKPFPGITGIRALARDPSGVAVRFGPPPGARWVIVGLRSMAVFVGKMTLIENDEPRDVTAGSLVLVADPTATLYVQAGNDAAIALGFASPGVLVALG
ncbi:MAG: hypothetical protein ABIT01_07495 [Thermoanaerobaculia bacterium]